MSKRKSRHRGAKKRPSRSGAPWLRRTAAPAPDLGPVERETLVVMITLRRDLGRAPEPHEVASRTGLGVGEARVRMEALASMGLPAQLTKTNERCLGAIIALEARLGRSPSTREVSDEMGLSPSGSRFHINRLASLGLVTPPEVVLVLSATPAGRAHMPVT
jgi:predicted transcriptional regulator